MKLILTHCVVFIWLITDKTDGLSLIDIFFTSGPNLETIYNERKRDMRHELKSIERKICVKLDDDATKDIVRQLTCIEDNFNHHVSSIKSIWTEATGTSYPTDIQQWRRFICSTKHFKIVKSLIDAVYIARASQSDEPYIGPIGEKYKRTCPHIHFSHFLMMYSFKNLTYGADGRIISPKEWQVNDDDIDFTQESPSHGIIDDEDDFDEAVDFCDLHHAKLTREQNEYCNRKADYNMEIIRACKGESDKGGAIRKKWIQHHQCLAKSLINQNKNLSKLKYCWRLITGTLYPSDPDEFVTFTCSHVYPNALRRIIDLCYEDRINHRFVSPEILGNWFFHSIDRYSNQNHLQNNNSCSFTVWKESEIKMLRVYTHRYYRLQSKFEKHEFCTRKNSELIGHIMSHVTCPMRKTTHEGRLILKFCWKFAGRVEYPTTVMKWKNLLCSRSSKELAQMILRINSCFAAAPDIIFGYKHGHSNYAIVHYFFSRMKECSDGFPFASLQESDS